jgi:protein-tyrosine phosphatase
VKAIAEDHHRVPFPCSYWVRPRLFLAGENPGDIDDESTRLRLSALLDAGILTFLNLTEEHETTPYADHLQILAQARKLDISVVRRPLRDRRVPGAEILGQILDQIDDSMAKDRPLFIHCWGGIGRTGTVVGCHLMQHGLATSSDVIEKIAGLRSLIPGHGESSPHTPEQIERVKTWRNGI